MAQKVFRTLHLGDSYTIGECVGPDQSWPIQLKRRLSLSGEGLVEPTIIAQTGWTTQDLLHVLSQNELDSRFDLVSLLIGVNNQYQGLPLEDYRVDFRLLMQKSIHYAGGNPARVVVLSIPDWGETPFSSVKDPGDIRRMIDGFNKINKEETQEIGAHWIDITSTSRRIGSEPSMIANDQLHPSAKQYTVWVDLIIPTVQRILLGED